MPDSFASLPIGCRYDDEKDQIVDYDDYEEANRNAKFPDPMYDETYSRFKNLSSRYSIISLEF